MVNTSFLLELKNDAGMVINDHMNVTLPRGQCSTGEDGARMGSRQYDLSSHGDEERLL